MIFHWKILWEKYFSRKAIKRCNILMRRCSELLFMSFLPNKSFMKNNSSRCTVNGCSSSCQPPLQSPLPCWNHLAIQERVADLYSANGLRFRWFARSRVIQSPSYFRPVPMTCSAEAIYLENINLQTNSVKLKATKHHTSKHTHFTCFVAKSFAKVIYLSLVNGHSATRDKDTIYRL